MQPKYFNYISKSKVEMLLAQVRLKKFSLFSFSPKVEFAGISLGADIKKQESQNLVHDTLNLLEAFEKNNLVTKISVGDELVTTQFYHSEDLWHHGLFYLRRGTISVTLTYILWRTFSNSIILLAGSPENLIGKVTAKEGVITPSTIDIMPSGPYSILQEIEDTYEGAKLTVGSRAELEELQLDYEETTRDRHVDWTYAGHTHSRALPISMFCFRYLSRLPEMSVDTVFKIFSTFDAPLGDCLADLNEEYKNACEELDRDDSTKPEHYRAADLRFREKLESDIREANSIGLQRYKRVYLGSPIYTALA